MAGGRVCLRCEMEESSCQYQPNKKVKVKVAQSCLTLWDPVDCSPPGSSVPGILLTQGSNLGLLHCRQILYRLSHEGSPPALWEALYIRYRIDSSHDMHRGPLVAQWQGICLQCSRRRFDPRVRKIRWRRHGNHSSILAWRVLWTEKPGGLPSTGSKRVGQDWAATPPLPHLWASAQSSSSWELVKLDFEGVVIWFQRLWALPASFPLHLVLK